MLGRRRGRQGSRGRRQRQQISGNNHLPRIACNMYQSHPQAPQEGGGEGQTEGRKEGGKEGRREGGGRSRADRTKASFASLPCKRASGYGRGRAIPSSSSPSVRLIVRPRASLPLICCCMIAIAAARRGGGGGGGESHVASAFVYPSRGPIPRN